MTMAVSQVAGAQLFKKILNRKGGYHQYDNTWRCNFHYLMLLGVF